jgi:cytochrome P450
VRIGGTSPESTMAKPITEAPELIDMGADVSVDLHAVYRDARALSPVVRNQMGFVVGLRGRQIETIVSDVTRQMENETLMMQGITSGPHWDLRTNSILFANGDAHRRRRQPLARTFAFKLMEGMRPRASAVASELVEGRIGAGDIDFLGEISANIPARIIADILGIPRADLPYFQGLVEDAVGTLGFFDQADRPKFEASTIEFDAYVGKLLDDRRKNPRGDFLSEFAAATRESGELTEAEIRADVIALIVAGSDTTKNSIATTLNLLLEHPDQWAKFVADPDGMKKGVAAEGLRYEPVALGIPRFSVAPFELDGYDIPPGRLVIFSIVSACRDPEIYANPEAFDITRTDHPRWHFAFGGGAHRCLGEALARVEIEETLAAIAKLAPKTRITGPRPTLKAAPIRAVDQLRVAFA